MAAGLYELRLTNDFGVKIQTVDDALWWTATRSDRVAVPTMQVGLPNTFDTSLLKPDYMIQLWRAPAGGQLGLWRPYLIRKWRYETFGAQQSLTVTGVDPKDLLRRRIVAAYSGVAQSAKTNFADDMLKEIVTESIADGVAPVPTAGTRVWADFTIAPGDSAGPTLTKAFAWRRLHRLLPLIQRAAKEAGTEVFFDVVPVNVSATSIAFEFRTFIGQPGADKTGVVFAQEFGNMSDPFLEFDYTEEENYVYAGGQGQGAARITQQVSDAARYGVSKWARCEAFVNATQQTAVNGVRESGRAQLDLGKPRRRFGATPVDTRGTKFGRDWDYGDKVTARYRGFEFETIVRAVTLSVVNERETINGRLEFED